MAAPPPDVPPDDDLSLDGLSLGEVRHRVDVLLDLIGRADTALQAIESSSDPVDESQATAVFDALAAMTTAIPRLLPGLLRPGAAEAFQPPPGEPVPVVSRAREAELLRLYEALADLPAADFAAAAARHGLRLSQAEVRLRRDRLWKIRMEDEATLALQRLLARLGRWVESLGATLGADLAQLAAALGGAGLRN
jgi:hypothetical protein